MTDTFKIIISFVKNFLYTIKFFIYLPLKTDCKNHIPYMENGQTLMVLANGPSLRDDIERINFNHSDVSVLNEFYKSSWYSIIKPKYYVVADPGFFSLHDYLEPFINEINHQNWEMILYVPYYAWRKLYKHQMVRNKLIEVRPFSSLNYKGFDFIRNYLYVKGFSMPRLQNVLGASIFIGINMGYKKILLYGADHSWTRTLGVNNQNIVCAIDVHFYDNKNGKYSPYWKNPEKGETYYMHELLSYFAIMFESYHRLKEYADYRGCRIINCTKDSFIDAFERC